MTWHQHYRAAEAALMRNDYETAARDYELALERGESTDIDDEHLASCLLGLAAAKCRVDKTADVAALFRRAKELREKLLAQAEATLGDQHPKVADSLDHCAFHALKEGEPSQAILLHARALAIRKAAFGEMSFEVANTLMIMAYIHYRHAKNETAAAGLWEQSAAILEKLHSECDVDENVATSLSGVLHNLASLAFELGEYERAESLFRRVIAISSQTPGTHGLGCYEPLFAQVLVRMGKHDEAESVLNEATSNKSRFAGRMGGAYKEAFIELYKATGRAAEAEALESSNEAG